MVNIVSRIMARTRDIGSRWQHGISMDQMEKAEISKVIIGNKNIVDHLLVGLLVNGHILLEGLP